MSQPFSDAGDDEARLPSVPYVLEYKRISASLLAMARAIELVRMREDAYTAREGGERIGHLHVADVAHLLQPLARVKKEIQRIERVIASLADTCAACPVIFHSERDAGNVEDLERAVANLRVSGS